MSKEIKISAPEKAYLCASKFFDSNNVIYFNKHFYLFHDGIWRKESDENTRAWIAKSYMSEFEAPSIQQVNQVLEFLNNITYESYRKPIKYLENRKMIKTINTQSGILNLDTLELKKYEKEDFCFHKLPFDYIADKKCPVLKKFLTTSMNYKWKNDAPVIDNVDEYKETMRFIQEWMGYTLIPGNPLHKALIMHGDGRNGKGVLQFIWSQILGAHNVSHVDIRGINNGRETFMTRNKLANFSYDLEAGQQLDTGVLKAAVAGEILIVDEKYKAQQPMEFTAKIVIACNDLPYIKNTGAAVRERFYTLPFDKVFEESERDMHLKDKLMDEAGHIFSWAVDGLRRLQKRGHFIPPERCVLSGKQYLRANDSLEMWLEEDGLIDRHGKARRDEVWNHYKMFCEQSKLQSGGKIKFYSKMERKGFDTVMSRGKRYFKGITLPNQYL